MPEKSKDLRYPVHGGLYGDVAEAVRRESNRDNRSINNMIHTLVLEALKARNERRARELPEKVEP